MKGRNGSSIFRMILFLGIILFIVGIVYLISFLKPPDVTSEKGPREGFQQASGYASSYTPSTVPPKISRSSSSAAYTAYQATEDAAEKDLTNTNGSSSSTTIDATDAVLPDLGGLTEFDMSNIPWDADNKGVLPSTVLWGGPVHSLVSSSIFAKQYGGWLAAQQKSISLNSSGTNYTTISPLFGIKMSSDNIAGEMASNIGEQALIMYAQNEIFGRVLTATRNDLLYMINKLRKKTAPVGPAVASAVKDESKAIKNLDQLMAHLVAEDEKLAVEGLERTLPAGSFKTLFSTKAAYILQNPVQFISEPITAALGRRWPGAIKAIKGVYKVLRLQYVVKFIEKCLEAVVASFAACNAIALILAAPLLIIPGGQVAAAAIFAVWETIGTYISLVTMTASIVASTVLAEMPIANNVCPAGSVDLCAFLPSWAMMLLTIVPILGDVISTLYPYMCWGGGGLTMKQPLENPPSFYSNPAFTTSYFQYKPSPGECQDGSTLNSIAESGVCQARNQTLIRVPGEGQQGCVITWDGNGNPHGSSYNGQEYVDFSDSRMLKRMAQFYYDNSKMNPLISYDLSGNKLITYEMIYKIYGVAASSLYSGDIMCDILYITYNPIDNSSYSETLSQFHDRRFYCYPYKNGTDLPSDGLLSIQACTFVDGTAPEVTNTGISLGSSVNPVITNTVRPPPTGEGSCIKRFTVTPPSSTHDGNIGGAYGLGVGEALFGLAAGHVAGKMAGRLHNQAKNLEHAGIAENAAHIRRLKLRAGIHENNGLIIGMGGAMGLSHIPLKPKDNAPSNTIPPSRKYSKLGDPASDIIEELDDGTVINYGPAIFSSATASGYNDGIGWDATTNLNFCAKDVIQAAYCAQKDVLQETVDAYHTANPALRIKQVTRIEARGVKGAPKHQACYYEWEEAVYDSNTGAVGLATTSKSFIREYTITNDNIRTCVYTPSLPTTFYDATVTSGGITTNTWYKNYMQPRYVPVPITVPFSALSGLSKMDISQSYVDDSGASKSNDLTSYKYLPINMNKTYNSAAEFLATADQLPAPTKTTYRTTVVSSTLTGTTLPLTSGETTTVTPLAAIDIGRVYTVNSKVGTVDINGSLYTYDTVAYPASTAATTIIPAYRYRRERFYPITGPFVVPLPSKSEATLTGSTQPANTTTCETPAQLQLLLDQFNEKSTSGGQILRILRAFTSTSNTCDLEVEMQRDAPTPGVKVIQKETVRVTVTPDTVNTYPANQQLYAYVSDTAGSSAFDTGNSITAGTPALEPSSGVPYFTSFVQSIKSTYNTVLQSILNSKPEVTISGEVIAVDNRIKELDSAVMATLSIGGCKVGNFSPPTSGTMSVLLTDFYNKIATEYKNSTGNTMTSILGIAIVPPLSTTQTTSSIEVAYTYTMLTGTNIFAGVTTSSSSTTSRFTVSGGTTSTTSSTCIGLDKLSIVTGSHTNVGQQYDSLGKPRLDASGNPIVVPSILPSCGSNCIFSTPYSFVSGTAGTGVDCTNSTLLTNVKNAFEGLNGTGVRVNVTNTMDQVVQSFHASPVVCEYQIHKNSITDGESGKSYLRVTVGLDTAAPQAYTAVTKIAEYNPNNVGWPESILLEDNQGMYTDGTMGVDATGNPVELAFPVPLLAGYDPVGAPEQAVGSIVNTSLYTWNGDSPATWNVVS